MEIRVFLAIEIPEHCKSMLLEQQQKLKQQIAGAIKWTSTQSWHITTKFIGSVLQEQIPDIIERSQKSCLDISPFQIHLKDIGIFGKLSNPRIIWAGVYEESQTLHNLNGQLEQIFSLYCKSENRYNPHITLARVKNIQEKTPLKNILEQDQKSSFGDFTAEKMILFQSELTPKGAVYTPLQEINFCKKLE